VYKLTILGRRADARTDREKGGRMELKAVSVQYPASLCCTNMAEECVLICCNTGKNLRDTSGCSRPVCRCHRKCIQFCWRFRCMWTSCCSNTNKKPSYC